MTLFLLGKKGFETLLKLETTNLSYISKVVIGTDEQMLKDYASDIESFCLKNDIPHSKANKENSFETPNAIGWKKLIDFKANQQLIVFHDSLLPRLRGFNPLVTALINGDKKVGVTALFASQEYDRGEIIAVEELEITYPIKIEKAIDLISECYSRLGNLIISKLRMGKTLDSKSQNEQQATYSLWRNEEDYFIDWNDDSEKISRHIDAVGFPYKGAKTLLNNQKITIINALSMEDVTIENRVVGKVIFKSNDGLVIVCGKGLLLIQKAENTENQTIDFKNKFRLRFK